MFVRPRPKQPIASSRIRRLGAWPRGVHRELARSRVFLPTAAHITPAAAAAFLSRSLRRPPEAKRGTRPPARRRGCRLSCARASIRAISCSHAVFVLHFAGSDPSFYVFFFVLPAGSWVESPVAAMRYCWFLFLSSHLMLCMDYLQ